MVVLFLAARPGYADEAVPVVDPSVSEFLYLGAQGDNDHPQASGIYHVDVLGPTHREFAFRGVSKAKVRLTGLQPGLYIIRVADGTGNVTEKRIQISRYVPGPGGAEEVKAPAAEPPKLPALQNPEKTIVGPSECRILTFGLADGGKTNRIFSGNDFRACLWDVDKGTATLLERANGNMGSVHELGPGRFVIGEAAGLYILNLDPEDATILDLGGRHFEPSSTLLSPDRGTLAVSGQVFPVQDRNVRQFVVLEWDMTTRGSPRELLNEGNHGQGIPSALCFSSDSRVLIVWESGLRFLERSSGKTLQVLGGSMNDSATSCQFSPDSSTVYLGTNDGIRLLRRSQGGDWVQAETWLHEPVGQQETVVLSGDGRWLASIAKYRLLRLWDTRSAKVVWSANSGDSWMRDMQFSRDGHSLSLTSYADGSLRTWDVKSGRLNLLLKPAPQDRRRFE